MAKNLSYQQGLVRPRTEFTAPNFTFSFELYAHDWRLPYDVLYTDLTLSMCELPSLSPHAAVLSPQPMLRSKIANGSLSASRLRRSYLGSEIGLFHVAPE